MKMNLFNSVKMVKPKENTFDLTHDVKMSGRMGDLMPCCLTDVVPGDKFTIGSDLMVRFAPLIAPVMHRIDATIHYFFVPNRILWENWEKYITNEEVREAPYIIVDDSLLPQTKKLLDYLGVPPCPTGGTPVEVSAFPLAAYQCIYNEYYRDQNLIAEVNYKLTDGLNTLTPDLRELRLRAWEHDYFTASLPFAQKGQAVTIPLGEVELKDNFTGKPTFRKPDGTNNFGGDVEQNNAVNPAQLLVNDPISGAQQPVAYDPDGTLQVGATTINELRRAFRLQEWLEKNARGGTRYIENILVHFGVRSSDKRLQRPEYITGVKTPIVISEVLNMTGEDGGLPQGNMAGHGIGIGDAYQGYYQAEEHGFIMGILSIMPKTAYQQGIPKMYLKKDPLEYFWPSFAHIGEQEVKNAEIFAYTTDNDDTFGYVPRYAEYKFLPNRVAGDFRTSLDYWHLGRKFANLPTLSQEFVEFNSEDINERIFAVDDPTVDQLYIHILNKISARRPMPVFGTPNF